MADQVNLVLLWSIIQDWYVNNSYLREVEFEYKVRFCLILAIEIVLKAVIQSEPSVQNDAIFDNSQDLV